MDDLSGLDWSSTPSSSQNKNTSSYPALRPSPTPPLSSLSGRSTPSSNQPSGPLLNRKIGSKPSTPANDSFSGLLSIGGSKGKPSGVGLSLQERQRQLQEEKAKQDAERAKNNGFGSDATLWDSLGSGSGKSTPDPTNRMRNLNGKPGLPQSQSVSFAAYNSRKVPAEEDESDMLAAFNSSAPVDNSSHFPVPRQAPPGVSTSKAGISATPNRMSFGDDDDPFGLNQLPKAHPQTRAVPAKSTGDDDFDILGDLGKPVSELPPKPAAKPAPQVIQPKDGESSSDDDAPVDPRDRAVAEIVDMGFPAAKAAEALEHTSTGSDVQAAVSWLLNQAHSESKSKREHSQGAPETRESRNRTREANLRERGPLPDGAQPAWSRSSSRRQDGQSPAGEKDVAQYAQDIGSSLFKSANSLWKTGRKQVQKAVAELQQDSDSSQPKWMRDAQMQERETTKKPRAQNPPNVTDEALMLEAGVGRPPARPTSRSPRPQGLDDAPPVRRQTPQGQPSTSQSRPMGRITREDVEEQSSQAYISPARRRKTPTPTPEPPTANVSHSRPSALSSPPLQTNNPFLSEKTPAARATPPPSVRATPKPVSAPLPTRPKAPPRNTPSIPPTTLAASTKHRKLGTEAFKRGDYGSAHELYTRALAPLPSNHPISIVILTNRALTGLKNGDPKSCIADADAAITIVGVSRGESEMISLGPGEEKSMSEFWGKALTRKAEALEAMEKWADAAKVWRETVEAGVGGAIAIQGRNRSEKAAGGTAGASSEVQSRIATPAGKKPAARPPVRSQVSTHKSTQAVKALREANKAAERADDEKFALIDQVDAKLAAWKGTKADNLRALLGSLDNVLWPEAGWKKVGMGELVMPNKVKIVYMKAIAKVHPDKLSQTSTTEQKMISAAVFSTLNEAWDKFKTDNGL